MKEIDIKKLFEVALDQVVNLEEGLFEFSRLLQGNYELKAVFENPQISKTKKKALIQQLYPAAPKLFLDLTRLIIDEGLEHTIISLSKRFTELVAKRLEINFVEVSSAYALTDQEAEKIKKLAGGKVYLRVKIDPGLIAGVKFLTSDGRLFDGTIQGAVERLKEELVYA